MKSEAEEFFKKGDVILKEGSESQFVYIIKSGKVRVVKEVSGRIIPIAMLGEKEFIGEMSLFRDESSHSAYCIAYENTILIKIQKKEIFHQLGLLPDWINNLMGTLADRLHKVNDIVREHKIVDEEISGGIPLTPEEEVQIQKALSL